MCRPHICLFFFSTVNLIPTTPTERQLDGREGAELAKSRKRVFPETHPPGANSAWDAYSYCNTPNRSEQAWEGETARSFAKAAAEARSENALLLSPAPSRRSFLRPVVCVLGFPVG